MIIIGIILSAFAIGFLCWLLFTLAIYALPFFVAMTAGVAALHGGAGAMGATAVGVVAGSVTLTTGQLAFAAVRSPFIRAAIALLFAAPAAVAGYHATLALVHIGVSSPGWGAVFAAIGGTLVGATAWARMTLLADPLKTGRAFPTGAAEPLLASAGKEG